jgi:hypothetical protein
MTRISKLRFLTGCMSLSSVVLAQDAEPAPSGAREFQSAGNPIIADSSYFTADAAPLSHNGKLHLYVGHDEPELFQGGFVMNEYGILTTENPATGKWTLHPRNLAPGEVFPWATGGKAFAGHCIRGKDGRFYWYVPVEAKEGGQHPRMAIGVAVADGPLGPWRDPVGKPLVTWKDVFGDSDRGQEVIDPHAFIDDDGKPYLYWGSWGVARVVGLADSMVETVGEIRALEGLDAFFEAPWVFKRGGTYYMAYDWKRAGSEWTPSNYQACIGYATATNPIGPWKFQGIILSGTSATTVHPSIIEHGGKWWITYHTRDALGGGHFRRSVAIDELHWDGDRILPARQTLADPLAFRLTNNLARDGKVSASFTEQPPTTLGALNDGRVTSVRLPPDQWGNYRGNTNTVESDWIRYDWEQPVRIEGAGIMFHQDPNWTRPPADWAVEYMDESGAWKPVRGASYPTEPDQWHDVRFEPVTTRALRATLRAQQNGNYFHSFLVSEFEVHGVQATKLPVIEVGMKNDHPDLPASVELEFPTAGRLPVKLIWRELPVGSEGRSAGYIAEARAIGQAAGYIRAKTGASQ